MIKQLYATAYIDPIDGKAKLRFDLEDNCFPEFQKIAEEEGFDIFQYKKNEIRTH
jgi:hypothetical protein